MTIRVHQKVKSIMWQSVGEVQLINVNTGRVYVEFKESSRHNGWFDISELLIIPESSNLSTGGFSHA